MSLLGVFAIPLAIASFGHICPRVTAGRASIHPNTQSRPVECGGDASAAYLFLTS